VGLKNPARLLPGKAAAGRGGLGNVKQGNRTEGSLKTAVNWLGITQNAAKNYGSAD